MYMCIHECTYFIDTGGTSCAAAFGVKFSVVGSSNYFMEVQFRN